jgi:hypothetical protein
MMGNCGIGFAPIRAHQAVSQLKIHNCNTAP